LQVIFGYLAAKWSNGPRKLKPWMAGFYGRFITGVLSIIVFRNFPSDGISSEYFALVLFVSSAGSFFSTIQFVSLGSFFSVISDPVLLSSNLGNWRNLYDFVKYLIQLWWNGKYNFPLTS
jgi:PAT family acetyl-CoA transporter-like MFS transporter 1